MCNLYYFIRRNNLLLNFEKKMKTMGEIFGKYNIVFILIRNLVKKKKRIKVKQYIYIWVSPNKLPNKMYVLKFKLDALLEK